MQYTVFHKKTTASYFHHFSLKCWPILIILSPLLSQMNCRKTCNKATTSPQICCRTTLWKLNVQLCNFTARFSMRVWCKIVNLQNQSTRCYLPFHMSTQINLKYQSMCLKNCLPSARTRVSSARHCISDGLLTLQCKTFSRYLKILQWC